MLKVTKRHYYRYRNPKTGEVREFQYERAIKIMTERELWKRGFEKELEIYWDPFAWKVLKQLSNQ